MPRYPFVYINEYLQEIPAPVYNDITPINTLDSFILIFLLAIALTGCILIMQKMNLLFSHAFCSSCCSEGGKYHSESISYDQVASGDDEQYPHDVSSSGPARTSAFSRLWGAMGWHRQPLQQFGGRKSRNNLAAHHDTDDHDEEAAELMESHR